VSFAHAVSPSLHSTSSHSASSPPRLHLSFLKLIRYTSFESGGGDAECANSIRGEKA